MKKRYFKQKFQPLRVFAALLMLTGVFVTARPACGRELTWEDAWTIAREQNPTLQSAQMDLVTAREQVNEARSAALPQVSLAGQYTRNIETPVFFFNSMAVKMGEKNTYAAQIELQQPIWVAGKVGIALKIAKNYLGQTEAGLDQTKQSVFVTLAQTYYGCILAHELVKTTETAHERAAQHRDNTRMMYEQGVVSEYDKIRAEVQVANLEPPVLEAHKQYVLSLAALRRMLNLPPDDSLTISGSLELDDTTFTKGDANEALKKRAEMRAMTFSRHMQQQMLSLAKRDLYLPSVYASVNWATQTQSPDYEFGDYSWYRSSAAVLTVSIPLFDGFRTPSIVKQRRAALRRLDYAETDLKNAVRMDVEESQRELERAIRTVTVHEQNVHEAQRGYDIAKVRYESGVGTQLELLDSELQLDQARVARLQALYDAKIARIQLQRALGEPLN
jgi:outer membrane protein